MNGLYCSATSCQRGSCDGYHNGVVIDAAEADEDPVICLPPRRQVELVVVPNPADVIAQPSVLRYVVVTGRHRHWHGLSCLLFRSFVRLIVHQFDYIALHKPQCKFNGWLHIYCSTYKWLLQLLPQLRYGYNNQFACNSSLILYKLLYVRITC